MGHDWQITSVQPACLTRSCRHCPRPSSSRLLEDRLPCCFWLAGNSGRYPSSGLWPSHRTEWGVRPQEACEIVSGDAISGLATWDRGGDRRTGSRTEPHGMAGRLVVRQLKDVHDRPRRRRRRASCCFTTLSVILSFRSPSEHLAWDLPPFFWFNSPFAVILYRIARPEPHSLFANRYLTTNYNYYKFCILTFSS